jgi:hypothetical protein
MCGTVFVVELRNRGVLYNFDYDFAPSDETGVEWTKLTDEFGLDGSIHIKWITVNGKDRPVTTEVLAMMERAAAIEEFTIGYQSLVALYRRSGLPVPRQYLRGLRVVSRLAQTSEEPPADPRRA